MDASGIITSPGYPQPYESGRQCIYEIESEVGKAIVLDFIDFDIEDTSYPDCDFDNLQVYYNLSIHGIILIFEFYLYHSDKVLYAATKLFYRAENIFGSHFHILSPFSIF